MKWFSGSLAQAISFAQTQKRVFVAYVEGSCEKSQAMYNVFLDTDVITELEKASFVCVKLEANGIGYKQLVEVYRNVPIPSLFFISHDGRPLDIVEGSLYDDSQSLKSAYLEAAEYSIRMNTVPEPSRPAPGDKLFEERRKQTNGILEGKRKLAAEKRQAVSLNTESPSDSLPNELKQQEAKKKIKDPLIKKMEEEMEKERRQEALARQRILDQIAEDKAARAAKFKKESEPKPSSSANSSERSSLPLSSEARIQFRLPTGESRFCTFQKDANLTDIRSYIEKNLELPFRNYRLVMTFPRREFTPEDDRQTLEELNLLPSAVLLILPISGEGSLVSRMSFFSLVTRMVQDLLTPLYSLSAYIHSWFSRPREPQDSSQPTPNSRNNQPPRTYVKKSGNIHSLKDLRDGNDENNTWNGNSTQQM